MIIKINQNFISSFLFTICVIIPTFNNYELTFATWLLTAFITIQNKYSLSFMKYLFAPLSVLIIAFYSSFYFDYKNYNLIRDITYLLKPILGLLIGYQLCRNNKYFNPFTTIVYAGLSLATIHIFTLFISFIILQVHSVSELRHLAGYFSDFEVYAIIVLIFAKNFNLNIPNQKKNIFLLIICTSSFLYLARTNFIQFGVLTIAMLGYLKITRQSLTILASIIFTVLLSYTIIYSSNPKRNGPGIEEFLYKIKIAPFEAFKTKINEEDWRDFNDNYRSFENIITVKQVTYEGWHSIIFGKGLGSYIDIGRKMWTNDGTFIRYVPALHNSYMTVFLKSGIIGVLSLFYFIFILLKSKKSNNRLIKSINLLFVGTAIFLLFSNWVFMGLYFKVDNKSILIGFLICYKEILEKRDKLNTKLF